MKFYSILFYISLFFIGACFNYETQYDGPYSEEAADEAPGLTRKLVYVSNGFVFLSNDLGLDSIIISSGGTVKVASINNSHSKVLFKELGENIQEYDIESGLVARSLSDSENAYFLITIPMANRFIISRLTVY